MKKRAIVLSVALIGAGVLGTLLVQGVRREMKRNLFLVSDLSTLAMYAPKDRFQSSLEGQTQLDVYNEYGNTPLIEMIGIGNVERVVMLLERGAGVEIPNEYGLTPLCCASIRGYDNIVKLLLERGADPNRYSGEGYTPLICAFANNRYQVAHLLISRGADIRKNPTKGMSIEKMCENGLVSKELQELRLQAMK